MYGLNEEPVGWVKNDKIVVAISRANCFIPPVFSARVAELVDAHDSGSCVRKDVEVRVLSSALAWGRIRGAGA